MGWSAWALDNIWWVAGGSFAVSMVLHYVIVLIFKNSGKKQPVKSEPVNEQLKEQVNEQTKVNSEN